VRGGVDPAFRIGHERGVGDSGGSTPTGGRALDAGEGELGTATGAGAAAHGQGLPSRLVVVDVPRLPRARHPLSVPPRKSRRPPRAGEFRPRHARALPPAFGPLPAPRGPLHAGGRHAGLRQPGTPTSRRHAGPLARRREALRARRPRRSRRTQPGLRQPGGASGPPRGRGLRPDAPAGLQFPGPARLGVRLRLGLRPQTDADDVDGHHGRYRRGHGHLAALPLARLEQLLSGAGGQQRRAVPRGGPELDADAGRRLPHALRHERQGGLLYDAGRVAVGPPLRPERAAGAHRRPVPAAHDAGVRRGPEDPAHPAARRAADDAERRRLGGPDELRLPRRRPGDAGLRRAAPPDPADRPARPVHDLRLRRVGAGGEHRGPQRGADRVRLHGPRADEGDRRLRRGHHAAVQPGPQHHRGDRPPRAPEHLPVGHAPAPGVPGRQRAPNQSGVRDAAGPDGAVAVDPRRGGGTLHLPVRGDAAACRAGPGGQPGDAELRLARQSHGVARPDGGADHLRVRCGRTGRDGARPPGSPDHAGVYPGWANRRRDRPPWGNAAASATTPTVRWSAGSTPCCGGRPSCTTR
jgi:hypothetical protein